MNTIVEGTSQFEVIDVRMADEWDHRAALVSIRIGAVTIRGIQVWRNPRKGWLKVYFPSYPLFQHFYEDAIVVDPDLRTDIEAAAIAAYKEAKKAAPRPVSGENNEQL